MESKKSASLVYGGESKPRDINIAKSKEAVFLVQVDQFSFLTGPIVRDTIKHHKTLNSPHQWSFGFNFQLDLITMAKNDSITFETITSDQNHDEIPRIQIVNVDTTARLVENRKFYNRFVKISNIIGIVLVIILFPLGILSKHLNWGDTTTFLLNFGAILPLSKFADSLAEHIGKMFGQKLAVLFDVTFGHAVDLTVAIITLTYGQIYMVKAFLFGSIISSLLLILGLKTLLVGIKISEHPYPTTAAQTDSSLMTLAALSLVLFGGLTLQLDAERLLNVSRGASLVLLIVYVLYLYFKLKTHAFLYAKVYQDENRVTQKNITSLWLAFPIFVVATVAAGLCADYMVNSIEGLVNGLSLSKSFIGFIFLPFASKMPELRSILKIILSEPVLTEAVCEAADASVVTPLLVILGWIINQPMTLAFGINETIALFISALLTNLLVQNGKSNWLGGVLPLAVYVMIALAFYFYPNDYPMK
ncbi:hypothetical protein G9A89_009436 [Geosiphon pyriformis]|nr:hypothetical protein G9A89_009436 [Geosiphon pyriformis]